MPRPDDSVRVSRVVLQRRHVGLPPAFNYFGQRLRAALRVERHTQFSRSLLLSIPSLGVPLIGERLRTVAAAGAPTHDVLARPVVPRDAHAARSIARSLPDEPTGPLASGNARAGEAVARRPASIHARKSSGETRHLLRTFDPTSSPARSARRTVFVEKDDRRATSATVISSGSLTPSPSAGPAVSRYPASSASRQRDGSPGGRARSASRTPARARGTLPASGTSAVRLRASTARIR